MALAASAACAANLWTQVSIGRELTAWAGFGLRLQTAIPDKTSASQFQSTEDASLYTIKSHALFFFFFI